MKAAQFFPPIIHSSALDKLDVSRFFTLFLSLIYAEFDKSLENNNMDVVYN